MKNTKIGQHKTIQILQYNGKYIIWTSEIRFLKDIFNHIQSICGAHIDLYAIGGTFEDTVTGR